MATLDGQIICGFYSQFDDLTFTNRKKLKTSIMQECNWSDQTFSHKKMGKRRLMIPRKTNKIKVNEVESVTRNFANYGIEMNTNNSQK